MGRRRNVEIHLKPEQVERLQAIVKARTSAQAVVRRAQILLLRDQGKADTSIAAELKITRVTISNCVGKFLAMGLEAALGELARPGRPKVVDDEAKAWVVDIACTRPCDHPGYSQESWSIALLADYVRRNLVSMLISICTAPALMEPIRPPTMDESALMQAMNGWPLRSRKSMTVCER